jgi:uncharacterized membrane protein
MGRSLNPRRFLTPDESRAVERAIAEAERNTSAEVKLVVVRHCWDSIQAKAARIFTSMGLDKTRHRNCVMIMLITTNREFLVYGDAGIHEKVGQAFWDDVRSTIMNELRQGHMGDGLCAGIRKIGARLSAHFAYQADDIDEISNEVAYEE